MNVILSIIGAGAVGGAINAYLSDNGFVIPQMESSENRKILRPGFLGNIFVGAISSLISWGLYGPLSTFKLDQKSSYEASMTLSELIGALLVGISGARWLSNEVDKKLLRATIETTEMEAASKPVATDSGTTAYPLALNTSLSTLKPVDALRKARQRLKQKLTPAGSSIIILFMFSLSVNAQTTTYDFQNRTFGGDNYVKFKHNSIFKITNVNTFIYDIKIAGENVKFNTDPPGVFKLFFDSEKFAKPDNTPVGGGFGVGPLMFANEASFYKLLLSNLEFTKVLYDNMLMTLYDERNTSAQILNNINALDQNLILQTVGGVPATGISIISNCQNLLTNQKLQFARVTQAYAAIAAPTAAETDLMNEIKSIHNQVLAFKYDDLFKSIAKLYEAIKDPNVFTVYSSSVSAEGDIIRYTIDISPKKDLRDFEANRSDKFSVDVPIVGGLKVDFSTGLFATFDKNVFDQTYRLDSIPDEGYRIVKNGNKNQFLPSIGAMMHMSFRSRWVVKPALSLGLGINSTNLENSSYFLGLSGILGNNERVVLSVGVAGTKRQYLKPQYEDAQIVPFTTKADALTERTFRLGRIVSFIAITYNLTTKKEEQ